MAAPIISRETGYHLVIRSLQGGKIWPAQIGNLDIQNSSVEEHVENEKGVIGNPIAAVLPSEVEKQEITIFESDKQVNHQAQVYEAQPSGQPFIQHTDSRTHSVISFLQRPQVLFVTQWSTEDQQHASIGKDKALINIPETLLKPMIVQKLVGFTSFKATAVIRLQVQSQPFMAGRLMLGAVPMPTLIGNRTPWILSHASRLMMLNHVQMDISKETEVTLRIPFISPYNSYDLISGLWSWAQVKIMVYSPLSSVQQKEVDVVVWGHFEDIELGAPTSGAPGALTETLFGKFAIEQGPPTEAPAQAVHQKRTAESAGIIQPFGVIDKIGGAAQGAWRSIGKAVPPLAPITGILENLSKAGTSIVGGILGNLGGLFGWSKPQVGYSGRTILNRPTEYFATSTGVDHSHVLALVENNAITNLPDLAGTSVDEMSFDFIKRIPIYVTQFKYTRSDKATSLYDTNPTPLWQSYVAPTYFIPQGDLIIQVDDQKVEKYNGFTQFQPNNLHYAISCFEYWTGSLDYTFKFIKTDYHSGRVQISFHPFTDSIIDSDYCYKLVVDLREKTEVTVAIPYIAPVPWKKIETSFDPLSKQAWKDVANYTTGKIVVTPLTQLMCSDTIVEKSINVLVEVRAGQDFRVSCPVKSAYLPVCLNYTGAPKPEVIPDIRAQAVEQSGLVHATVGEAEKRTDSVEGFEPNSITGDNNDIQRMDVQPFCAGETFDNYRSLTRRFGFVNQFKFNWLDVQKMRHNPNQIVFDPSQFVRAPIALFRVLTQDKEPYSVQFTADTYVSPLSFVGSMYAFYRGGLRFKFYPNSSDDLIGIRIDGKNAVAQNVNWTAPSFMSPLGIEMPQAKKIAEVQVPYYGNTYVSCAWPHAPSLYDESPLGRVLIGRSINDYNETDQKKEVKVFTAVAASDDLDFKVFLGSPAVITRELLTTKYDTPGQGQDDFVFSNERWDVDPLSRVLPTQYVLGSPEGWQNVRLTDLKQFKPDPKPKSRYVALEKLLYGKENVPKYRNNAIDSKLG